MSQVAKRGRGRPKGAKNKKSNLSGATVERICEYRKFNPAEKLIAIANGEDQTAPWTKDDQFKATAKLFDAIHCQKSLPGGVDDDAERTPTNYEIVFVESDDDFILQGAASSEVAEAAHNREPL